MKILFYNSYPILKKKQNIDGEHNEQEMVSNFSSFAYQYRLS